MTIVLTAIWFPCLLHMAFGGGEVGGCFFELVPGVYLDTSLCGPEQLLDSVYVAFRSCQVKSSVVAAVSGVHQLVSFLILQYRLKI